MKFILASGSPRRREILESFFSEIEILPPHIDETVIPGENPADYTLRIVNEKMDSVLAGGRGDALYLSADTIVTIDGIILGKPASRDEAFSMLSLLAGREHSVITGLCLVYFSGGVISRESVYDISDVRFKELDADGINSYLDLINYRDKAGSYAAQEHGEIVVDSISGSVTNVIGLPLRLFFRMMGSADCMKYFF
ncbi:MAG TPA: nucleoside triphosphate pyrophosphatase [Spirochaetota bacterium]|nr:nucleoside triphosphate pyrophosphatase [Spirochaetota bacterium]HPJ34985.1 nucleoside triphosphate pyrophosphatase [Spirochaetota bacterium]